MNTAINSLKEQDNFSQIPSALKEFKVMNKKIETLSLWVDSLHQQLAAKTKLLSVLDLKSRKANLIFDGVPEVLNEDLYMTIGSLLNKFVPNFVVRAIKNVFPLGKYSPADRTPRQILGVFNSLGFQDAVLNMAGSIAKAGLPGAKIYMDEDLPDDAKGRRADTYKYVQYIQAPRHDPG